MPQVLIDIIVKYGYLAIFCLVFFQEMGFSLFPNEILLIYFGYLAHEGILYFPLVFGLAITADISGTTLLFTLFYYFNPFILRHKPKWLKLPYRRIVLLKRRMEAGAHWRILIGRLTPFVRPFTSVVAGSLRINPKKYGLMILLAAVLWTGGFVVAGWFMAPFWDSFATQINHTEKRIYGIFFLILLLVIISRYLYKKLSYKPTEPFKSPYHEI